jgi:hypothetical protein
MGFAARCVQNPSDSECTEGNIIFVVAVVLFVCIRIYKCYNKNGQARAQPERLLEQAEARGLRAQAEAQSRERNERLVAATEAASARAAQNQAARIAGLRVDGNLWSTYDGIYTKVGDNQGWPCYKKREVSSNKYLFRSVASKEWCIGREINGSSWSRIKSVSGPVPTGTQTWQIWLPDVRALVARTFSVAEVVRHMHPSWFVRLGTESGVDLTVQMFARRGRLRSSSTMHTTTRSSAL